MFEGNTDTTLAVYAHPSYLYLFGPSYAHSEQWCYAGPLEFFFTHSAALKWSVVVLEALFKWMTQSYTVYIL